MTLPGAALWTLRPRSFGDYVAGTRVGLADELFEDAKFLADKGLTDQRQTLLRRSISTAYYAAFHLFIE